MKLRVTLLGILIATLASPGFAAEPASTKASQPSKARMAGEETGDSKMGLSQGVDRLLADVYKRQKTLAKVEREVASREAAVAELERLIEERIVSLEAGRIEIEERIASWENLDGDRIQKLAKVYTAMPPANAARLLETLELDLAVAVLGRIKGKNSAQVLAVMEPRRALLMSQRMLRPLSESPAAPRK